MWKPDEEYALLRERAERQLDSEWNPAGAAERESANHELRRLVHELQIHQIELSMQYDELRRAQVELECSRAEYQALYDEAPVGYFSCKPAGELLRANPTLATMLGTTVAELLSAPFPRFAAPDQRDAFYLHVRELEAKGTASCETQLHTATGERLDVRLDSRALRDEHGAMVQLNVTVIDLTAAKRAQERVRELAESARRAADQERINKLEAVGVLAGGIAHDFNNLLTSVLCSVALARAEPAQADETLAEAEAALAAATGLTRQLVTFAKGGGPVKKATALAALMTETARFSLRGSNADHEISVADDLWAVDGDEGQLSQVIQNLVINAAEAMPAGGRVRIVASNVTLQAHQQAELPAGDYVHISISDDGVGMPDADLAKVFDPYFTTKDGGSGLGLATVFSVVRRHGGWVSATSQLGVGTTMQLYLPALPNASPHASPQREQAVALPTSAHILIMDDDPRIRRVAERTLSQRGYRVDTVAEGAAAVEAYRRSQEAGQGYDVVLMDLTIVGGMGGVEAMAELRRLDPSICAVVMSGYSVDPVMTDAARYGFRRILQKPFGPDELARTIEGALEPD